MSKKNACGLVLRVLAVCLTVAGLVIYVMNANGSYYGDFSMQIPMLSAACLAVEAAIIGLYVTRKDSVVIDLLFPVVCVLLACVVVSYVGVRVESAGMILGSDLESGNAEAMPALMQAFTSIGCYLVAMVVAGVSGAFAPAKAAAK